jgi:hypothetical protein
MPRNFGPFTAPSSSEASGGPNAAQKPSGLLGMRIDAGVMPWNPNEPASTPVGSSDLVERRMRERPRTAGAVGAPAAPPQVTAAGSYPPFGTRGQFAPGPAASSQPLYDTRSFAAPADGSSDADDAKNIHVLRGFIRAPDGSLTLIPLPASDLPQSTKFLDLLSAKPMTDYPLAPIFGFPDRSAPSDDDDDFFSRWIKPLLQQ